MSRSRFYGAWGDGRISIFSPKTGGSLYAVRVSSRFRSVCDAGVAVHDEKTALIPPYMGIYFTCYVFSIF